MQSSQFEPSTELADVTVLAGRETRVDGPHIPLSGMKAQDADSSTSQPSEGDLGLIQRIRTQAEQLTRHLRERQREIDRREAAIHAQAAELAHEQRGMRLWLTERQFDLTEREQNFAGQTADDAASLEAVARQRSDELEQQLQQAREEFERDRQTQLQEIEHRRESAEQMIQKAFAMVETRREAFEEEAKRREARWSEPHPNHAERQRQLDVMSQGLVRREERLARAEQILQAQLMECDDRRRELDRKANEIQERIEAHRRQGDDGRRKAELEFKRERELLRRRAEELDVKSTAVDRLREDLTRLHREALEMRMATEETWAQLSGAMAPAALTQSLARVRARLVEHDRLEQDELAARREELETLSKRIQLEHDRLRTYREQIQSWSSGRQDEIELQAKRLVEREQELDNQEARLGELREKWRMERRGYQDEIRRLLRLREGAVVA